MEVRKGKLLHEGQTKKVYETSDEDHVILHFKNDVAPIQKGLPEKIKSKGTINSAISSLTFQFIESYHIPTHFVEVVNPEEILVIKLEMIPVTVKVWNFATSELSKKYGADKGKPLACPIVEIALKDENHKNPVINADHACALEIATTDEMQTIDRYVRKINAVLKSFFDRRDLRLVELNLEFGRYGDQVLLGDEISLDTCRFFKVVEQEVKSQVLYPYEVKDAAAAYEELRDKICP